MLIILIPTTLTASITLLITAEVLRLGWSIKWRRKVNTRRQKERVEPLATTLNSGKNRGHDAVSWATEQNQCIGEKFGKSVV